MGSKSDLGIMQEAADFLIELNIPFEISIVSAHRTPDRMSEYAKHAREKGLVVLGYWISMFGDLYCLK